MMKQQRKKATKGGTNNGSIFKEGFEGGWRVKAYKKKRYKHQMLPEQG